MEAELRRTVTLAVVVVLLVGLGIAGVVWFQWQQLPVTVVLTAASSPPAPGPAAAPRQADLSEGERLLGAATGLSPDPAVARWLAQPVLLRRLVGAVDQVSHGESPRALLGFLGPTKGFSVEVRGGRTFISPQSSARYDAVTRIFASVDAAAVGRLYAQLEPFVDAAFAEVARPGRRFEPTFARAVDHLAEVPLTEAPLEVAPMDEGIGFQFVDPKLEALSPAQKHLLRMGPANARLIIQKLQDFRAAMSFVDAGA